METITRNHLGLRFGNDVVYTAQAGVKSNENGWEKTVDFEIRFDDVPLSRLIQLASRPVIITEQAKLRKIKTVDDVPEKVVVHVKDFGTRERKPVTKEAALKVLKKLPPDLQRELLDEIRSVIENAEQK